MIYHLLDEAEPFSESKGGAISRWAANVLRSSVETIVCPSYDPTWGFSESRLFRLPNWERTRYPVHALLYRIPWLLQKPVYLRIFAPLLERLREGDVVYIHNRPECAAPLATVAQKYGIGVVLHMHNSHLTVANRGQIEALRNTPIVFCSDFLRREVDATFPGHFQKTYLIYNGADGDQFHASSTTDHDTPTVIYTGRLVPYKGVHVLLEAMKLLHERGVRAHCKVVGAVGFGTGKRSRYVKRLLRISPENVEFTGYRSGSALAELLRDSDVFCAPSIFDDPFPLAPLEAMASGLPVVASRVGGIPETLSAGGGVLVPSENPTALADALQPLLQDHAARKALGRDALHVFRNRFSWSHVREQYQSVIQEVAP